MEEYSPNAEKYSEDIIEALKTSPVVMVYKTACELFDAYGPFMFSDLRQSGTFSSNLLKEETGWDGTRFVEEFLREFGKKPLYDCIRLEDYGYD